MTGTVWIHQARPRPAWYGLDPVSKADLRGVWNELNSLAVESGAEPLGTYSVRGQSDFSTVEIWRFDQPEDVFKFWSDRVEAGYAIWFAFSNQLGVSAPGVGESREP